MERRDIGRFDACRPPQVLEIINRQTVQLVYSKNHQRAVKAKPVATDLES
jgi:hypothetical protein